MSIVSDFVENTRVNGGSSLNFVTEQLDPKEGYFVSIEGHEAKYNLDGFGPLSIGQYLQKVAFQITPKTFIGSWVNEGQVCMDLSEQLFDKRQAIELGYKRNQLAIYDAAKGEVITLPSRQTSGTYTQQKAYITSVINRLCE
jgi:hypothetical protein